jgi:hypothetical protein
LGGELKNDHQEKVVGELENQITSNDSAVFGINLFYNQRLPDIYIIGDITVQKHRNIFLYDAFAPDVIRAFYNPEPNLLGSVCIITQKKKIDNNKIITMIFYV